MGVEIVNANGDAPEVISDKIKSVDSENVDIKFGSHGADEAIKREISESNLPKDVVDEWPEPKQIYSFYVVRCRAFEDQNLKAKLDLADKELQKKNQLRLQIVEKLKAKRADRSEVIGQIRSLSAENKQFRSMMDEKRKEMEPLQQALGKLRGPGGSRDRGSFICSSEEELNEIIRSLQYRIQHESIPLSEEKQILREIKQLEGTREKVIANAAERARIQISMGEKDAIQDQVKLIGVDLDGVRKEKQVVNAKLKQLDEAKMAIEKEIGALEAELTAVSQKRDSTFETIKDLRKQREEGNAPFFQNRNILIKAKSLAANKDVDALKEFAYTEVENFMSLWNSKKAFRDDYERRIWSSLDMRQLSRDGRLRNPGEKPLILPETAAPEIEVIKTNPKQTPQEDAVPPTRSDASSEQKVQKTKGAKSKKREVTVEETDPADQEEFFSSNKLQKDKEEVVDEKTLKEQKKQEEIAKRKQAEERKKKQVEKAATKAAIKARKEAEKKLKEREKRARKKTGAAVTNVDSEESTEATAEVSEPEKVEEKIETTTVPQKNKDSKEGGTIRPRVRSRAHNSLPKAILKRKKATNYWLWGGAAAAALVALILAIVGYKYLKY